MSGPLTGRSVLVTGANRGIGQAIAAGCCERGAVVWVGARSETAAVATIDGLPAGRARPLVIDISDPESVTAAAAVVRDADGRLDALVNNAAIKLEHHPSPPSAASLDDIRATFEVNVFGTIATIQAFLPLLLAAPHPRVVNLSSGLGSLTYATTPGSGYQQRPLVSYSSSKAALNMATVLFANEFRHTALRINAADPGPVATPMTQGRASRRPEDGARVVFEVLTVADDGPTGCFFDERGQVPW